MPGIVITHIVEFTGPGTILGTETLTRSSAVQDVTFGGLQTVTADDRMPGGNNDSMWTTGETLTEFTSIAGAPFGLDGTVEYFGLINVNGTNYPIVWDGDANNYDVLFFGPSAAADAAALVASTGLGVPPTLGPGDYNHGATFTECFAEGTQIASVKGNIDVENLLPGDMLRTADGGATQVLWVGYQDIFPIFAGERDQPVRIGAGALGANLPTKDLIVTADHALVVDGTLANASALVNYDTIDFVSTDEHATLRVYHVETEGHDLIIANGCAAESYLPTRDRSGFANYQEYLDLFGTDRFVPESYLPRITSRRLLPTSIREIVGHDVEEEISLTA